MIVVHCACGEVYRADDDKAGYSLVCSKCKRIIDLESSGRRPTIILRPKRNPQAAVIGRLVLIVVGLVSYNFYTARHGVVQTAATRLPVADNPKIEPKPTQVQRLPDKSSSAIPNRASERIYLPTREDVAVDERDYRNAAPPQPAVMVQDARPQFAASLPTGTDVTAPVDATGRSTLTVINGNAEDAVVKLVGASDALSPHVAYRYVYVKAGDRFTVRNLSAGRYSLLYRTGNDWDGQGGFTSREQNHRFGRVLEFEETTSTSESGVKEIEWSALTVTLHSVFLGNVKVQSLSKEDFDRIK